jgi:acetyl-CoA carboxylase carboxyltransferase component
MGHCSAPRGGRVYRSAGQNRLMAIVNLQAPVQGIVIALEAEVGEPVAAGRPVIVMESMKMELPVEAPFSGWLKELHVAVGDTVAEGDVLASFEPALAARAVESAASTSPQPLHPELATLSLRREALSDAARPEAVARRHAAGGRTVRENLADLLDPGSFSEYGALAVAAQRSRRPLEELIAQTPADGLVTGIGTVNATAFGAERARCAVMAYDYSVLAGTQGVFNHKKSDRLLELASRLELPVVLFAEGGGGRPGDVDWPIVAGLDCTTFARWAALSGRVPRVGIVAGRCFAGNAALLGCSDLIIATESASIGMGGPAMIEGGGLGKVAPEEVGPVSVLAPNGVIDLRVADEAAAVAAAKRYLGYFQGTLPAGEAADQASLRHALPENRNALYDPRKIIETLADAGSVMELRAEFGPGVITALVRLEGRPVALAASHPRHLAGALDAPACDKLARFMQLADAFGLPLVTLVDTPGFMVGPASEATAMVRHAARLFVNAAALRVPVFSVVLRRGYGLGAMALTAGHFHAPVATAAWPSAEFGAMGIDGAVRLGFRKQLDAAGEGRQALFNKLVADHMARGRAINMASHLEIDDVIDPAETRAWLARGLGAVASQPLPPRRDLLDTW